MPSDIIGQIRLFPADLLHLILAEIALAGFIGLSEHFFRFGLRNANETDFGSVSSRSPAGASDSLFHALYVFSYQSSASFLIGICHGIHRFLSAIIVVHFDGVRIKDNIIVFLKSVK